MLLISYYLHSTRTERTASATFQNSIPFIKMRSLKMSTSTGSGTVKSRFKKDLNLEIVVKPVYYSVFEHFGGAN